jgi:hypothetical protein
MRRRILGASSIITVALLWACSSSTGDREPVAPEAAPTPVSEAAAPADESEPLLNRIKWTTASEVDNFGFDIYRSTNEDGPFERINSNPIPGAGTVDEPTSYEYEDTEIDPTRVYYYYIESISINGIREVFSPVIKAKAKRPVE